ncbi:hypothetical protein AB9K41_19955 [Cribrihabitans sp. XS_ASV171]
MPRPLLLARMFLLALLVLPGAAGSDVTDGPDTPAAVEIVAPQEGVGGATLAVGWTGPAGPGDYIEIGAPGGDRPLDFAYTDAGNPLDIVLPPHPGVYELRYVSSDGAVLDAAPITLAAPELALDFPARIPAGSSVDVAWAGPDQLGDTIRIGREGDDDASDSAYTRSGNPAPLIAPTEPGRYEIRYVFRSGETLMARPITVRQAEVSLDFPAEVPAGSSLSVKWSGPDQATDNIQIVPRGGEEYVDYAYTRTGNPVELIAPVEAGAYDVQYRFRDSETLLTKPLVVTEAPPTLDFPGSVPGGSRFEVAWTGPDQQGDAVEIAPRDGGANLSFAYTRQGSPLDLDAPLRPGEYEIRYVFRGDDVLLRQPITVTPPDLELIAPESVTAGADFQVGWKGPDRPGDNIQIGRPGDAYSDYSYVRGLNPVPLTAPEEPGEYELRYMFRDSELAIAQPITVTE